LTTPRKSLLRDVRGAAIYIELLVMVPLIALLWMSARYVHRLGDSGIDVQRQARECAWAFAAGGCQGGVGPGCEMAGPARLDNPELERLTGSGFENIVRPIQDLAKVARLDPTDEVVMRTSGQVQRVPILGGTAETTGMHRILCNDRPRAPQLSEVVDATCNGLLGGGGRCP
jgi:hypothetical protein